MNIKFANRLYQNANQISGERLDILRIAFSTFASTQASQAAASLAYYAIFSLFPLLLVLIAGGSYFMNNQQVYQTVLQFVQNAIPASPQTIEENLKQVLMARGAIGITGLLTLVWSASSFFSSLAHNINLAWPNAPRRNFLGKRLVALGMIGGLIGLLAISLSLNWMANLIPVLDFGNASSQHPNLWILLSNLGSWLTLFLLFLALYRWVPSTKVHWSATIWGALFASAAWKIAATGFNWYLQSGLGRYKLVYGSLGAIVALLFLIFIVSLITLFGAHFCAAIDRWENEHDSGKELMDGSTE